MSLKHLNILIFFKLKFLKKNKYFFKNKKLLLKGKDKNALKKTTNKVDGSFGRIGKKLFYFHFFFVGM